MTSCVMMKPITVVVVEAKHKRISRTPNLRTRARLNLSDMRNNIAGIKLSLTVSRATRTSSENSHRPRVYKAIDPNMTSTMDGNHRKKATLNLLSSPTTSPHRPNITAIKSNP